MKNVSSAFFVTIPFINFRCKKENTYQDDQIALKLSISI